ncbi:FliO/MopB family protein [Pirellulaceae bacterium SH501]
MQSKFRPSVTCSWVGSVVHAWPLLSCLIVCTFAASVAKAQSDSRGYGDPSLVQPRALSVQGARTSPEQQVAPMNATGLPPANVSSGANPAWTPPQNPQPTRSAAEWPSDQGVQSASYTAPASISTSATVAGSTATKSSGIALKAPKSPKEGEVERPSSSLGTVISVVFSLGIVLSLFLGLAWLYRKSQPQGTARLPTEIVQILGRTTVAPRQSMMVVRFGSKLLLVSQQPGQTETLAEISDPAEVDRLAGICESKSSHSSTQSFSNVLLQVARVAK